MFDSSYVYNFFPLLGGVCDSLNTSQMAYSFCCHRYEYLFLGLDVSNDTFLC